MVVVADGMSTARNFSMVPTAPEQQLRVTRDQHYFEWCDSHSLCVAMLVFLWNTVATSKEDIFGVSAQPIVRSALTRIGAEIKGRPRPDMLSQPAPDIMAAADARPRKTDDDSDNTAGQESVPFQAIPYFNGHCVTVEAEDFPSSTAPSWRQALVVLRRYELAPRAPADTDRPATKTDDAHLVAIVGRRVIQTPLTPVYRLYLGELRMKYAKREAASG